MISGSLTLEVARRVGPFFKNGFSAGVSRDERSDPHRPTATKSEDPPWRLAKASQALSIRHVLLNATAPRGITFHGCRHGQSRAARAWPPSNLHRDDPVFSTTTPSGMGRVPSASRVEQAAARWTCFYHALARPVAFSAPLEGAPGTTRPGPTGPGRRCAFEVGKGRAPRRRRPVRRGYALLPARSAGRDLPGGGHGRRFLASIPATCCFPFGDDARVYPGAHGPATTIGQERRTKPVSVVAPPSGPTP